VASSAAGTHGPYAQLQLDGAGKRARAWPPGQTHGHIAVSSCVHSSQLCIRLANTAQLLRGSVSLQSS